MAFVSTRSRQDRWRVGLPVLSGRNPEPKHLSNTPSITVRLTRPWPRICTQRTSVTQASSCAGEKEFDANENSTRKRKKRTRIKRMRIRLTKNTRTHHRKLTATWQEPSQALQPTWTTDWTSWEWHLMPRAWRKNEWAKNTDCVRFYVWGVLWCKFWNFCQNGSVVLLCLFQC